MTRWVVRRIEHKGNGQEGKEPESYEDKVGAEQGYKQLLTELASDFPQDVTQVDLYLEKGKKILKHHVVKSNGCGGGNSIEFPVVQV